MPINHEFKELLRNLQNSDNDCRNKAEATYDTIESKSKFEYLLQVVSDKEVDLEMRVFAGVLCRRLLDSCYEECYSLLPLETQVYTKQQLLSWIMSENDATMRKKISDIVIEVAKEQFDDEGNLQWPELLTFVFDVCLCSSETCLVISGFHLLSSLPHILGDKLLIHIDSLCAIFARTMMQNDGAGRPQSLEVREASAKAFSSFVVSQMDNSSHIRSMSEIVSLMLQTIADSIMAHPDNDLCMKALVDLADSGSDLLKYAVNDVLLLCTNIMHNGNVDESQKHLAIEVFVSLTENCPAAVRKCPTHLQSLMEVLFKMLTDLEDDSDWSSLDVEEEEDERSSSIVAEMALDRISCAMRGKKVLHEITHTVPAMLHSPKWQERHGGLMAISSCAEGLNKVMAEMLGGIVDEIVPLLADPHPRVRYAACNAIGQLSTDFGHKLQKAYHSKVVPALLAVLDANEGHPRVQAYAGAAIVNFCEDAPISVLLHYLPVLADKLLSVLRARYDELARTGRRLVLEQCVTTVAAVADSVAHHFLPYYHPFMAFLKPLLGHCVGDERLSLLRAKAIECVSLMGLAVGRDVFLGDAQEVMQLLLLDHRDHTDQRVDHTDQRVDHRDQSADNHDQSADHTDPHRSYMISAWARMCKILGKDFASFLPLVIDSVLSSACIKPDVCMMYNDEADEVDKHWQVVKIADDQNFAIHTTGLEDKATACQMLVCFARELSDSFFPYVLQVADIMIPLLRFYFNEEVRSSAADIMPHLIECSRPLGDDVTRTLWERILASLLSAIREEPYREQAADMLDSVAEGIKKMGVGALTWETMAKIVEIMKEQFEELFKSQDGRVAKRRSEEYDEDDEERLEADKDEDDQVLCKLVDLMHALFLVYKEEALVVFEEILGNVVRLMEPGRPWTDLQYGICFWDDMIETMGARAWKYSAHYLSAMLAALGHDRREIRQAAVYGFGLMAMYGGACFDEVLVQVCPVLVGLVEADYSRAEEVNMSTENAISALGKVIKYRPGCVSRSGGCGELGEFVRKWVSWLPVWEDTEETVHVYGLVCDLLEANDASVLCGGGGHDGDTLAHVTRAIVVCWHKHGMSRDTDTHTRCVNVMRTIQANQQYWDQCLAALSNEERDTLYTVLHDASQ